MEKPNKAILTICREIYKNNRAMSLQEFYSVLTNEEIEEVVKFNKNKTLNIEMTKARDYMRKNKEME